MKLACGIVLLSLLPALPLSAQFSGRATGSVVDASGAAVPGADVNLYLAGGAKPLYTQKTSGDGLYHFIALRPGDYDLSIEAKGFIKTTIRGIAVDAARETPVAQVKLQLAAVSQSVDVTAEGQGVEITNAEISGTITMDEIRSLPILDRDVLSVMQTQPGVVSNGNSATVINGLRTSYSDVTFDGINVQDNYIRDNALDYLPNKLLLGQVRQMTLVSSNGNAAASTGATLTALSSPSGTNQLHGDLFWQNRNNYFSANDWFNNQSGIDKPFLNQNQFGGSLAGPIKKDKLFFFTNYEAIRTHQQTPVLAAILTASARNGIFTYNAGGVLRTANLLTLRSLTGVDPTIQNLINQTPGADKINSADVGDGLNYSGYRFNQRDNGTRDNIIGKIDYNISTGHAVSGTYTHNRFNIDRPDAANGFTLVPQVYNPTHADLLSLSWRWTPTSRITNELRGGFNLTYAYFNPTQSPGAYQLGGMLFTNPVNQFMQQGRDTNTYTFSDDAAYQRGRHYVQFGFNAKNIRVRTLAADGTLPAYTIGLGQGHQDVALARNNLPGISSTDLATANALLATVGGYLTADAQTFNVTGRSSGFVAGAPYIRHFILNDYSVYLQDKWRAMPRLTLNIGLRYQMPGVADERDSLELSPVVQGSVVQTLLSDATLDFTGKSAGRPWYKRPKKDFAPSVGFAWDVFGNGRTALRGSYSISFVNDQEIVATENMVVHNAGLQGIIENVGLKDRLATGLPKITAPAYKVPRKLSENYELDPTAVITTIDPNLNRPHVQQYSFGIQHDFKGTILEARYVGNHVVGAYRAFDFNQVQIVQNGFLADFLRAQRNGFLAQARNGVFNPAYNPNIAGSQALTVFPKLFNGGFLNDPSVQFALQTGVVADLATLYQVNGLQGDVNFFPNPNALAADMLTNYSSSSYNSLQLEARHRLRSGLSFEGNYTYSKVLSDGDGDLQTRFQAFLDINNPKIERSRANFDLNHMIKADAVYELPFGNGHRINYKPLSRLIGGWRISGTMVWQSGAPFSITSGRGTLNRAARSYYNTANTSLNKSQLNDLVKFQMTGDGPMIVSNSAINPDDGTGVNIDGEPFFKGQIFSNPSAGTLGVLQRRYFSGPWTFGSDLSVIKSVNLTERHRAELRMDALNAFNHATFWSGDQNINSNTFGTITSMFYASRVLQFGLKFSF